MRALLIRNPVARTRISDDKLSAVIDVATGAGWEVETIATDRAGRATELARDAAARAVDVIVVHGGDGTINEAANGIAGTETALAVLRGGTANVWAKEIGVPKDPVKAMRAIVGGERRRVDLGRANGRYFLLMAGVGLDARIINRVSVKLKRRIGAAAYVIAAVPTILRTKAVATEVRTDGEASQTPLYWLLAGNTRSYGGVVRITHRAMADDGLIDVALMRRGGAWRVISDGVRVLLGRHERSPNVRYAQVRELVIDTPGIPVQVDGELYGETPLRIDVMPGALSVIVPRGARTPSLSPARVE